MLFAIFLSAAFAGVIAYVINDAFKAVQHNREEEERDNA